MAETNWVGCQATLAATVRARYLRDNTRAERLGAQMKANIERPSSSVMRALTLLEVVAVRGPVGVTEMADELGVNKSTISRVLGTMSCRGLVERTEGGRYGLGRGALRLACAAAANLPLVRIGHPPLRRLAEAVDATGSLAILSRGEALVVDQVAAHSRALDVCWLGDTVPLHATAVGKILLCEGRVDAQFGRRELEAWTPTTITSPSEFLHELSVVRRQGFASEREEFVQGVVGIAAAVRNLAGDIVAAVGIAAPAFRTGPQQMDALVSAVVEVGDHIAALYGQTESAGLPVATAEVSPKLC